MNTLEGTVLIMNDGEEIFVEHSKEQINQAIDQAIAVKRNYITITHLDRDIYFNYIKDKKSKKRYLSIEAPKQEYKELTTEARKKRDEMIEKIRIESYPRRRKKFIEDRKKILEDLEKKEKNFDLESTKLKIQELNNLRQLNIKKEG